MTEQENIDTFNEANSQGEVVTSEAATAAVATAAPAQTDERALIANVLANQNNMYAFLSALFRRELTQAQIDEIPSMRLPAQTQNAHLDKGYRNLVRYMNHSNEFTRTELATDFLHTFIGNTQNSKLVAYPYESVQTSPERLLLQESHTQVLAAYRENKVALNTDINEPEDHIAFELEFMQIMGERAYALITDPAQDADAYLEPLRAKRDFLIAHLLEWTPKFVDEINAVSKTLFYRAVGDILLGCLELDNELLDELVA